MILVRRTGTFQFHIGSIQSWYVPSVIEARKLVSIPHWFDSKMRALLQAPRARFAFQFHIGSIQSRKSAHRLRLCKQGFNSTLVRFKVEYLPALFRERKSWFQFHIGSIQRHCVALPSRCCRCVSIPHWFDSKLSSILRYEDYNRFQFHIGSIQSDYVALR